MSTLQRRSDTNQHPTHRRQCRSEQNRSEQNRSAKTRSEQNRNERHTHSFIFIGQPRSGNDDHNVRFSEQVEDLLETPEHSRFLDLLVADSGAGCSIISNGDLLTDIREAPDRETMRMHCNSGSIETNRIGELEGYGTVWYNPDGIANIISIGEASVRHRITMDTSVDNAIFIHKPDGTVRRFACLQEGIYCCNTKRHKKNSSFILSSIISVETQEQQYSTIDVHRAK